MSRFAIIALGATLLLSRLSGVCRKCRRRHKLRNNSLTHLWNKVAARIRRCDKTLLGTSTDESFRREFYDREIWSADHKGASPRRARMGDLQTWPGGPLAQRRFLSRFTPVGTTPACRNLAFQVVKEPNPPSERYVCM
jgi:hypothetical protein